MSTRELQAPLPAIITTFSDLDQVGRLRPFDTSELRFGRSACQGFSPAIGLEVFITAVADHPLGGLKAVIVRSTPTTEGAVRDAVLVEAARAREATQAEEEQRRREIAPITTLAAITRRVVASIVPEEDHEADRQQLYALVADLDLIGPSLSHVHAILQGIADSRPDAFFGSPGPLVHFIERVPGSADLLFEVAARHPVYHLFVMLARYVNGGGELGVKAAALLRSRFLAVDVHESVRREAEEFLQRQAARSDV